MVFPLLGQTSNPAPKIKHELATCHTEPNHTQLQAKQVYLYWQVELPKVLKYAASNLTYSPEGGR